MLARVRRSLACVIALWLGVCAAPRLLAQDNVTVPKSRLQELERKEKELDSLKGLPPTAAPSQKPEPTTPAVAAASPPVLAPPPEPIVRYSSPALDSLHPLKPGDIVDSMDLANYYHADHAAADRRFLKQKIVVRGEIVGFEKPLWKRSYRVLLKTPIRGTRVICDLLPPDKANAVFTTNHGDELMALMGEQRVPLIKIGETVIVKGECKGYNNSVVLIYAWDIKVMR